MNSDKIFLHDGASLLESEIMKLDLTDSISEASYFVNLDIQSLIDKTFSNKLACKI